MAEFNTIRLLKGNGSYTKPEYENFSEYDTILDVDSNPKEIKRWNIADYEKAKATLDEYKCSYLRYTEDNYDVTEYALELFVTDDDGDFAEGSDYIFAEREN